VTVDDARYRHVALDLADTAAVERCFAGDFARQVSLADYGRIGLVNNAATVEPITPSARLSLADFELATRLNLVVPVWLMGWLVRSAPRAALRILNVSSGAATVPLPSWSAYCATKAGLRHAGAVFGAEQAAYGPAGGAHPDLAIVSYSPGIVDTEMQVTIRGHSAEDFPQVHRFVGMYDAGQLDGPQVPAADMVTWLNRDDLPPFSEGAISGYAERVQGVRED
jgi:NAD(P)-dependent dehydrogenase (short-subunit alcohol dehydrogenase family)